MKHPDLVGSSVVVTGVASGLGRAIAEQLAGEGASVVGCDVNDEHGRDTMAAISGSYKHADVSVEADVEALIAHAIHLHGRIDAVINNAAIQIGATIADTTEDQLDRVLAVNLKGPFFGTKHAAKAMLATGGGSIVNIASILALVGDGMLAAYCAAKGGVVALTRATAVQYGGAGIRCNAICPGDIDTPIVEDYFNLSGDPAAARAEVESQYPLGRIATAEEVARTAVFLCSSDASFVTGQTLIVDGGLLAKCY